MMYFTHLLCLKSVGLGPLNWHWYCTVQGQQLDEWNTCVQYLQIVTQHILYLEYDCGGSLLQSCQAHVLLRNFTENEFYGHGAGFSNRIPIHFLWEHCKLRKYAVELLKFNKSNTDAAYAHLPALLLFTLIGTT